MVSFTSTRFGSLVLVFPQLYRLTELALAVLKHIQPSILLLQFNGITEIRGET